jgi:hypothetical protein
MILKLFSFFLCPFDTMCRENQAVGKVLPALTVFQFPVLYFLFSIFPVAGMPATYTDRKYNS